MKRGAAITLWLLTNIGAGYAIWIGTHGNAFAWRLVTYFIPLFALATLAEYSITEDKLRNRIRMVPTWLRLAVDVPIVIYLVGSGHWIIGSWWLFDAANQYAISKHEGKADA